MSVVIIGGGITGLTIGYRLQQEGVKCVVLEKAAEAGGLARSFRWEGAIFDLGPHFLFPDSHPEAIGFIKDVLGDRNYTLDYKIGIYFRGNYHPWPPRIIKMVRGFPPGVLLHYLMRPFRQEKFIDESFKSCIKLRHGDYLYHEFFSPYIEKKTGLPGSDIHIDWWLRPFRSFQHGTWHNEDTSIRPKTGRFAELKMLFKKVLLSNSKVFYPHGGMGAFPELLSEKFLKMGGIIRTGVKDLRLTLSGNRVSEVVIDNENTLKIKGLVWTAPIDLLSDVLQIDEQKLIYLPVMLCFVRLGKKARSRKFLYVYFGDREIIFNRVYFPSNISADFVPLGRDAVCVEITPGEDNLSDSIFSDMERLRRRVCNDLQKVGICPADSVEDMKIMNIEKAYPLYTLSYKEDLHRLLRKIREYENIWVAGRTGSFYNVLTDGAVKSGLDLAKGIIKSLV